ncbi:uroporphyrinogen decarboxylase family protein, partial [Candidatus Latescibacterota bacterium]
TEVFDVFQQVVKIENDVREIIKPDTVPLLMEPLHWKPFRLSDNSQSSIPEKWYPEADGNGGYEVRNSLGTVTARMPSGGFYFEPVNPPLASITKVGDMKAFKQEIESFDWPSFSDESLDRIGVRARWLYRKTTRAVVANLQLHLLAAGQILRGYEQFMVDLIINKRLAHGLLRRLTEAYIKRCERYFDSTSKYIQVVLVNDDLGMQSGPMLDPALYREMVWPYQKRLFDFIKSKTDAFILFHTCGSVYRFIPSLIEAGVDALNPVQVTAAEMDTKRLKREFGKDITFWGGGCDTQQVLRNGSRQDIHDEVKRRIDDLACGGGFVFTQVHNIQPDVPPENIMAMYEAYGLYR